MKCSKCGAEIPPGSKFCVACGAPVQGTTQAASALDYQIQGTTLQVVVIDLQPGQTIYSEAGGMSWMSDNIQMETKSGGLGKAFRRALAGESLFIVDFTARGRPGKIAFASEFPGKILPFNLPAGQSLIVQKDAFMCAEKSVDLDMHFRKKLGVGFFGGEGFIMERLTGPGLAFVEIDGEVVEYDLQAGEVLKVATGHVAALQPSVDFDIEMIKGFKNVLLGGEGLFLSTLRGPGKVWLQTMPMMNLARKIAQFMPHPGREGPSGGVNINLGGMLGR